MLLVFVLLGLLPCYCSSASSACFGCARSYERACCDRAQKADEYTASDVVGCINPVQSQCVSITLSTKPWDVTIISSKVEFDPLFTLLHAPQNLRSFFFALNDASPAKLLPPEIPIAVSNCI